MVAVAEKAADPGKGKAGPPPRPIAHALAGKHQTAVLARAAQIRERDAMEPADTTGNQPQHRHVRGIRQNPGRPHEEAPDALQTGLAAHVSRHARFRRLPRRALRPGPRLHAIGLLLPRHARRRRRHARFRRLPRPGLGLLLPRFRRHARLRLGLRLGLLLPRRTPGHTLGRGARDRVAVDVAGTDSEHCHAPRRSCEGCRAAHRAAIASAAARVGWSDIQHDRPSAPTR